MKPRDPINTLFKRLEGQLDVAIPNARHEVRFLEKLQKRQKVVSLHSKKRLGYKTFSIAASIAILLGLFFTGTLFDPPIEAELSSVSPELEKTQEFFTNAITMQLESLHNATSEENKILIQDALNNLKKHEVNYKKLKKDLVASGNDKRVISAMIINFQKRIALLENVLKRTEEIKKIKMQHYEKESI